MSLTIRYFQDSDKPRWDSYVLNHPHGTYCHLAAWKTIIEKTYHHRSYYLMALDTNTISGILPLIHLKHFLFGNQLISIPFFDLGGVLADDHEVENALISEALDLSTRLGVAKIELRQTTPLRILESIPQPSGREKVSVQTKSQKVRMLLTLPPSPDILLKSFKSKLRSQINKPMKEGLYSKIGGPELLHDFYNVFSTNMRDLGSPVHSKQLMQLVLSEIGDCSKAVVIYKGNQPLACSLIIGFRNILENPWASSVKEYSRLSPNMLLYWTMLEYGCRNGYSFFDFGRSSTDQGTYKFKEQWGAEPNPIYWHYLLANGSEGKEMLEKENFGRAIGTWKRLPVSLTRIVGPIIRKHIPL